MVKFDYLLRDLDSSSWHPHNVFDNVVNIQSFGNMGEAMGDFPSISAGIEPPLALPLAMPDRPKYGAHGCKSFWKNPHHQDGDVRMKFCSTLRKQENMEKPPYLQGIMCIQPTNITRDCKIWLHWILEGLGNNHSKHEQLFAHKMHPIICIFVVH